VCGGIGARNFKNHFVLFALRRCKRDNAGDKEQENDYFFHSKYFTGVEKRIR